MTQLTETVVEGQMLCEMFWASLRRCMHLQHNCRLVYWFHFFMRNFQSGKIEGFTLKLCWYSIINASGWYGHTKDTDPSCAKMCKEKTLISFHVLNSCKEKTINMLNSCKKSKSIFDISLVCTVPVTHITVMCMCQLVQLAWMPMFNTVTITTTQNTVTRKIT